MLIVLDSNLLHGRGDPEAASEIKPLLSVAKEVGVPVKIPEPCLMELREGFREKLGEAIADLEAARNTIARYRLTVDVPRINTETELAAYETRLQQFLQVQQIETIPFVTEFGDPKKLFAAAVEKRSPFDSTGNNFRDAVICLSVSQFARNAEPPILLITDDRRIPALLSGQEGFEALSLKDAVAKLESRLSEAARARRARLAEQIGTALDQRREQITQIARSAEWTIRERLPSGVRLVDIEEFVPGRLKKVEPTDISTTEAKFRAEQEGQLLCVVRGQPIEFRAAELYTGPTRIGESADSWIGRVPVAPFKFQEVVVQGGLIVPKAEIIDREEMHSVIVVIDGKASLDQQGSVHDIEFTVREKPPEFVFFGGPILRAPRKFATLIPGDSAGKAPVPRKQAGSPDRKKR
jgi:PIN domain-containing protein